MLQKLKDKMIISKDLKDKLIVYKDLIYYIFTEIKKNFMCILFFWYMFRKIFFN